MRSRTGAFTLACMVLATAACAGSSSSSSSPTVAQEPTVGTTHETPAAQQVPEVLDFEAPTLEGGTLQGSSLAGKDVAFWFWAPW